MHTMELQVTFSDGIGGWVLLRAILSGPEIRYQPEDSLTFISAERQPCWAALSMPGSHQWPQWHVDDAPLLVSRHNVQSVGRSSSRDIIPDNHHITIHPCRSPFETANGAARYASYHPIVPLQQCPARLSVAPAQ